jgi:hypothetical protein
VGRMTCHEGLDSWVSSSGAWFRSSAAETKTKRWYRAAIDFAFF